MIKFFCRKCEKEIYQDWQKGPVAKMTVEEIVKNHLLCGYCQVAEKTRLKEVNSGKDSERD